jgi:hypothetical protein
MQTRSKTMSEMCMNQPPYEPADQSTIVRQELPVDIDFDEASRAWNANKRRSGAGYYYVCGHVLANGEGFCSRRRLKKDKNGCDTLYCHLHA